ncbi:MAG TPA: tol-pal system protein YbgF [Devosia sp.]|jgi:tol-pal system protein YbgF|uniref:tol-pal system protein YbgF n=1 Tax=Devosia sp. TaxID=1871048 RepID=UPI002DDD7820|nr:tol-pal system protein YbgF [Devosia sp.]HEV2518290.1 tol-pal system protein YbgF [Devosia sp.]
MVKLPPIRGSAYRPAIYAALVAAVLAAPALAATSPLPAEVLMPATAMAETRIHVAQNQQSSAQLLVRIQELEDLIRTLTGRVEGLEFQLTQMQTQLAKQAEDNEFRFQELEGGAGGKPQAAAPTDGVTPSDTLPQSPAQEAPAVAATPDASVAAPPADDLPLADLDGEPMEGEPMDALGDSSDPLLRGGIDQLGTLPEGADTLGLDGGRPLDLTLGSGGEISSGDAKAQYDAGYDAMTRGDYAFAADQFQQFVALYPDDPKMPDAINWLGEALIQQGQFTDAAQALADGYTRYKDSNRAPDMMLKLGVALVGADQVDVGCRTFYTLKQRYTQLTPAFTQRLEQEAQKAKCPVS